MRGGCPPGLQGGVRVGGEGWGGGREGLPACAWARPCLGGVCEGESSGCSVVADVAAPLPGRAGSRGEMGLRVRVDAGAAQLTCRSSLPLSPHRPHRWC